MHPQDVSDPQQCGNPGVNMTGLDVLVGLAGDAGGEEHVLLGAVLAVPFDADAVADGASAVEEPGIVVGQVWHSSDLRPLMIIGQPGKPRIL
jgi:hypothetical protein